MQTKPLSLIAAVAVALVSALTVAGCGESQPEMSKEALTKPADTSQFQDMMKDMQKNVDKAKR